MSRPPSPGSSDGSGDSESGPLPPYTGSVEPTEVVEYDDPEFSKLGLPQAGVGFDDADLIAIREPSNLVRRYLFPTEKFRGEWRRHWIQLFKRMSIGVVATFVLGYLAGYYARQHSPTVLSVIVLVWLAVMGWVLWDVVEWYYDRFILTNKRVMLIGGLVARRVAMLPLARVTDMKYTQSPMGRFLGYGTFEIESAGQDQAMRKVENLPNPTDVYLQVVEEMYEPEASEARRRAAKIEDD